MKTCPSFAELFRHVSLEACGFAAGTAIEQAVEEMRDCYSWEKESLYGALGIELELVDTDDDWTKNCSSGSVDIPAFLKRLEQMKQGNTTLCPFCGGKVGMTVNEEHNTVFACGSCDMAICLEKN